MADGIYNRVPLHAVPSKRSVQPHITENIHGLSQRTVILVDSEVIDIATTVLSAVCVTKATVLAILGYNGVAFAMRDFGNFEEA